MDRDPLTEKIIGCVIEVHRELGPGLLESAYERCMAYELSHRGLRVRQQVPMAVDYKGVKLECGYRIDLLVDESVILELKCIDRLSGVHEAQLLTYIKLAQMRTGLLINFNERRLVDGVRRFKL